MFVAKVGQQIKNALILLSLIYDANIVRAALWKRKKGRLGTMAGEYLFGI
jgi:hypothetical protein